MLERKLIINAPIETVYQVIRDFGSYPEFISSTQSAKEKPAKGSRVEVEFSITVIKKISYTLGFQLKEPNEIRWEFIKGDLMKRNSGAWQLEKLSDSKTEATYQIDIDFGWLVPKMILEQVTKTQLPETLDAFKKRAEKLAEAEKKKELKK